MYLVITLAQNQYRSSRVPCFTLTGINRTGRHPETDVRNKFNFYGPVISLATRFLARIPILH